MRGFIMGLQIAVFHVLSATVLVALADLVLRQAFGSAPAEVAGVRIASYVLIALIGVAMTGQALRRSYLRRQGVEVAHVRCAQGHASHPDHHGRRVEQGALSLGGLVPCTGAVLAIRGRDGAYHGCALASAASLPAEPWPPGSKPVGTGRCA